MKKSLLFLFVMVVQVLTASAQFVIQPRAEVDNSRLKNGSGIECLTPWASGQLQRGSRAMGDVGAMSASVITNAPLSAYGYAGVLNSADGIQGDGGTLSFAAYFNEHVMSRFKGIRATGFRTAVDTGFVNVTFWIRKSLSGKNLWEQKLDSADFEHGVPITIPCDYLTDGEPIYMGFTGTLNPDYMGIWAYVINPCYTSRCWVMDIDGSGVWEDWSEDAGYYFELDCDGDGLYPDDATLLSVEQERAYAGEEVEMQGYFANYGSTPISNITFDCTVDGNTKSFVLDAGGNPMPYGAVSSFSFTVTAPATMGRYPVTLKVTSVNNNVDEYEADNTVVGTLVSINPEQMGKRVAVMEDITAKWCGTAPLGIVAVEKLQELYGEQFIPIECHNGLSNPDDWTTFDDLTCKEYAPIYGRYDSTWDMPVCLINRKYEGHPYFGMDEYSSTDMNITKMIDKVLESPSEAWVDAELELSADNSVLSVNSTAVFSINSDTAPYSFAYVVLEDSVAGTQFNSFSGQWIYYVVQLGLHELPRMWETKFNNVARGIYDVFGLAESVAAPIVAFDPVQYRHDITLPSTIEDLRNTSLVVMLLENNTGEIVAARRIALPEPNVVGVNSTVGDASSHATVEVVGGCLVLKADKESAARFYTADGRLVKTVAVAGATSVTLPAGNYIVRIACGNDVVVKKVAL